MFISIEREERGVLGNRVQTLFKTAENRSTGSAKKFVIETMYFADTLSTPLGTASVKTNSLLLFALHARKSMLYLSSELPFEHEVAPYTAWYSGTANVHPR